MIVKNSKQKKERLKQFPLGAPPTNMIILPKSAYTFQICPRTGLRQLVPEDSTREHFLICPKCHSELSLHQYRLRRYIDEKGTECQMMVPDYACRFCRLYDRILPEGFVPYKRCVAATIETVLSKEESDGTLDLEESTRHGWHIWFEKLRRAANPLLNALRQTAGFLSGLLTPVDQDVSQPEGWLGKLVHYVVYSNHRFFNQLTWRVHSSSP